MTLFATVKELRQEANADDIVLLAGGIIPEADRVDHSQLVDIQRLTRALETLRPSSRDSERRPAMLRHGVTS
jgi:methylmalonyl-CoA mutase cobalamin-binding subunit